MVEKTNDAKIIISLQLLLKTKKINSRYLKGYRLAKNNKDTTNWYHWDRKKNKSASNPAFTNISLPQISKKDKDKYYQGNH